MGHARQALHVTNRLRLVPPEGEDLPVETAWFADGDEPRLRLLVRWAVWERIADERLLGLDDEHTPTDLVPDNEVVLGTRLADDEVTFPDDQATLRTRLARPDEPLKRTATWAVTDVDQQEPLASATALTEQVFDDDREGRAHAAGIEFVSAARTGRPGVRERGRRDSHDVVDIPVETPGESGYEPAASADEPTASGPDVDVDDALSAPTDGSTDDGPDTSLPEAVFDALDDAGWPYAVVDDGETVRMEATVEGRRWDVFLAGDDDRVTVVSVHPRPVEAERRGDVASTLLSYNDDVDRGGFSLDDDTGRVRFRTPLDPGAESVRDAVTENVTAMAELYDLVDG